MKPGDPITTDQPIGTVIADREGDLWVRLDEGWTWTTSPEGTFRGFTADAFGDYGPFTLVSASDGRPAMDIRAMALDMAIRSYADEANPAELVVAARTFEAYLRGEQA